MVHSIVLNFISLFHWEKVQDRTVERRCLVTALCATVSKTALRSFHCGEQGCSFFRLRVQPVAQGWAEPSG
jgi:hypothetical protein